MKKKSITLSGHQTSVSMEIEFWEVLQKIASQNHQSVSQIIHKVDQERQNQNLSSALRVYILKNVGFFNIQ